MSSARPLGAYVLRSPNPRDPARVVLLRLRVDGIGKIVTGTDGRFGPKPEDIADDVEWVPMQAVDEGAGAFVSQLLARLRSGKPAAAALCHTLMLPANARPEVIADELCRLLQETPR